jgi:hypothetical protein
MDDNGQAKRELLRHMLATLAYRGGKAIANAPEGFNNFQVNETTRTPGQILSHIGDLLDWAYGMSRGEFSWKGSTDRAWNDEVDRFFACLAAFDAFLASDAELQAPLERLLQAPIADALTHVGQIAMLRRMAGSPVKGENYYNAEITIGRVGPDQSSVRTEFD